MKRTFYIICFAFLGLLVATLIHAVVELYALDVIFGNPARFADSFWWQEWALIHGLVSLVLWVLGFGLGLFAGVKFWQIIYVEGKRK